MSKYCFKIVAHVSVKVGGGGLGVCMTVFYNKEFGVDHVIIEHGTMQLGKLLLAGRLQALCAANSVLLFLYS